MRASMARLSQRLANMDSLPPREKWRKHPLLKPGFFNAVSLLPSVTTLLAPPRSCSGSD